MVDMGFIQDITQIISQTPKKKQVLLFGATISYEIDELRKRQMTEPVEVMSDAHVAEEFLKQGYYNIKPHKKFSLLVHLLKSEKMGRTIIFCSARTTCEMLSRNLKKQGFELAMIHGKLSQDRRLRVMEKFNRGEPQMLVASAVAARGLHIKEVISVISRLEGLGLQRQAIQLPKCVVLGEQSSGKSSVIEAISGVRTPRAGGTCTRCPL